MYKKAAKLKLRFQTQKGWLSVEDLFDLKLTDLDKIAINLSEELSKTSKKSFISEVPETDKITSLQFDIVKDVIDTKLAEKSERDNNKIKNAKKSELLEILNKKKRETLESLSIEELEKKIEELDRP